MRTPPLQPHKPWTLPAQGLAVFHGNADTARLSHYFLPRLLLQGKRVLFLDGANCADPRLLERLARQRHVPFAEFNRQMEIARAFTCFQLSELIARVPRFLAEFPAQVLVVTAFPDLYFDEDVRDGEARGAFERARAHLRRWARPHTSNPSPGGAKVGAHSCAPLHLLSSHPLSWGEGVPTQSGRVRGGGDEVRFPDSDGVHRTPDIGDIAATAPLVIAVFSSATTFTPTPARRRFFAQTCANAEEVWEFTAGADSRLTLTCVQQTLRRLNQ